MYPIVQFWFVESVFKIVLELFCEVHRHQERRCLSYLWYQRLRHLSSWQDHKFFESKMHGANMGPAWVSVGPKWAPCRPHEPCYLGSFWLAQTQRRRKAKYLNEVVCSNIVLCVKINDITVGLSSFNHGKRPVLLDSDPSKNEMSILTQFSPSAHLVHI